MSLPWIFVMVALFFTVMSALTPVFVGLAYIFGAIFIISLIGALAPAFHDELENMIV